MKSSDRVIELLGYSVAVFVITLSGTHVQNIANGDGGITEYVFAVILLALGILNLYYLRVNAMLSGGINALDEIKNEIKNYRR